MDGMDGMDGMAWTGMRCIGNNQAFLASGGLSYDALGLRVLWDAYMRSRCTCIRKLRH